MNTIPAFIVAVLLAGCVGPYERSPSIDLSAEHLFKEPSREIPTPTIVVGQYVGPAGYVTKPSVGHITITGSPDVGSYAAEGRYRSYASPRGMGAGGAIAPVNSVGSDGGCTSVQAYTRRDGTRVRGHQRC